MVFQAKSGLSVKGFYEVREGKCPKCHTTFDEGYDPETDDFLHPMRPDTSRWCPRCNCYKLGRVKQKGKIKVKR